MKTTRIALLAGALLMPSPVRAQEAATSDEPRLHLGLRTGFGLPYVREFSVRDAESRTQPEVQPRLVARRRLQGANR